MQFTQTDPAQSAGASPAMVPAMILDDPGAGTVHQTLGNSLPTLPTASFGPSQPVQQYQSPLGGGLAGTPVMSGPEHERISADVLPNGHALATMGSPKEYYPDRDADAAHDKLAVALDAIKTDIMGLVRKIKEEDKWVESVRDIMDTYNEKVARVEADIERLKGKLTELYKKKHLIENVSLQRKLETKLKEANSDLSTLQAAIEHVRSREHEFGKTKTDVLGTIGKLESQLDLLKGVKGAPHGAKHDKEHHKRSPAHALSAAAPRPPVHA